MKNIERKILSLITILLMFIMMMITLTACGDDRKKKDKDDEVSGPEETVEQFFEYIEKGKYSKASKLVDWTLSYKTNEDGGYYSYYSDVDYEEIEDMSSKDIKDYEAEGDNEIDIENAKMLFEGYASGIDDKASFKIIVDTEEAEKVKGTKNIYKIETDVEMKWKNNKKDDEETEEDTIEFYVMKDGEEYKIINGVYDVRGLLSNVIYSY